MHAALFYENVAAGGWRPSDRLLESDMGATASHAEEPFVREAVRRVLGIVENVGSGGVNGNRPGIRGRVRLFLSDVQLSGFKTPIGTVLDIFIRHFIFSFIH